MSTVYNISMVLTFIITMLLVLYQYGISMVSATELALYHQGDDKEQRISMTKCQGLV